MKLGRIHRGLIQEIKGLYCRRPKISEQLSPLEQLVLFGEVSDELIDHTEKERSKN